MRRNQYGIYDFAPPPIGTGTGGGVSMPPSPSLGAPTPTPSYAGIPSAISPYNPTAAATPPPAPNYMQNLLNDPIYQQEMAQLSAGGIQSAADRKAATDKALIQFGEIPNLGRAAGGLGLDPNSSMFQYLNQDIDAATQRGAAGLTKSGLSTVAKLETGHATTLDNLMSTLAARGIVRSGATGVGVGLENHNYADAQFTARNQLLDYLSGVQSAFTQSNNAMLAAEQAAAEAAAQRQKEQNPGTDTSGTWDAAINAYIPDSQWFGASPGTNYWTPPWEGH